MSKEKTLEAYEQLAESYNAKIDHKPHNAYYDRPNTLNLFEDVKGKVVLDAACGPGKYAEILVGRGATVVGVDNSESMIKYAKERRLEGGTFYVHDIEDAFTFCDDGSFDVILCALAMHYIKHWDPTIREFHRMLKPGGTLIVSIEHPFSEYNYYKSAHYFRTEEVSTTWSGFGPRVEMQSYRRPLGECLRPLTDNGFYIEKLIEPLPTEDFKKADARHYEELISFPGFMAIRAVRKPV